MEDKDTEGKNEGMPPETTDVDLENGIFNMVISLAHYFTFQGWTKEQACEKVALYLETISDNLRKITI